MRSVIVLALLSSVSPAVADPGSCGAPHATAVSTDERPATTASCMVPVDWRSLRRFAEIGYAIGAGGTNRSGVGTAGSVFAAVDLALGVQFGRDAAQPSYEVELSGGVTAQRFAGAYDATGLVTRAGVRLGPSRVAAVLVDEGRANLAAFPTTMELAHAGELAARPRIGARPELARSLYGRERIELATRVMRVEGAGVKSPSPDTQASSWALDLLPLRAGLDVALQDATRVQTTVGGALLGVVEHAMGVQLDLLGVEHTRIGLSEIGPTSLFTVWMLKLDGVNPATGSGYRLGWGEVVVPEAHEAFAQRVDPENGNLTIGGIGWYSKRRAWGGFGTQYRREPYVSMTGELGLEDRISGEVYVPRALGLVARAFGARTKRLVDDALVHDVTAGIELETSYARDGWTGRLGLEVGRTFYTALDDAMPTTPGFVASAGLTIQRSGRRTWQ